MENIKNTPPQYFLYFKSFFYTILFTYEEHHTHFVFSIKPSFDRLC